MNTQSYRIAQSLESVKSLLQNLTIGEDILTIAFGDNPRAPLSKGGWGDQILTAWVNSDFSNLPTIEVISRNILGNANGAFSLETNTIYLADDFVNGASLTNIDGVILEEIGHWVDAQINETDTLGDEGELFSALLQGKTLTTEDLARIYTENDGANITVEGNQIFVEQNTPIVLTVDTTADQNDGSNTEGLSLRDAILIANADTSNDYVIELQGGQTYSLSIKNTASLDDGGDEQEAVRGDLDIVSYLTIKSLGTEKAIIDATNLKTSFASGFGDSALDVKEYANLVLDGVTVTGASLSAIRNQGTVEIKNSIITNNEITEASAGNNEDNQDGGGINNNGGTLRLEDSVISNNKAIQAGGIFNDGPAWLTNTTISGNTAINGGGGIDNIGIARLTNTTISGNTANDGGGIANFFVATLTNTTISGNIANDSGGGIFNNGIATLTNTTISDNTATNSGGGGIANTDTGTATLTNTTISDNTATEGLGGGISNFGTATLTNTTISGNTAIYGGGITNNDTGTATLTNTTISGNIADSAGGIFNYATATLTNTTISGNIVLSYGGGILNANPDTELAKMYLNNSTITNNTADFDSDEEGDGGGLYNIDGKGEVYATNTIIAGNFDTPNNSGLGNLAIYKPDLVGTVNGNNHNLIGNTTGALGSIGTGTDIVDPNPKLGPLQDNGNGIFTHALLAGSPALDQGSNDLIPTDSKDIDADENTIETIPFDNRGSGYSRIYGSNVDIGAFEFQITTLPTLSINDVTVTEGNSGTKNATFTVTLAGTASNTITVDYATEDETATNGDYTSTTGTLTFAANETTQTITVPIIGDTDIESDETFSVNLSNPQNAEITDGQGLGTITNDDTPAVVFDDISIIDGDTSLTFSGAGATRIEANSSSTITNRLYAGSGNDTLIGSEGDRLFGGEDDDSLTGKGNDQLFGGNGNDTLTGETGSNILVGGSGQDVFLFNSTSKVQDLILDFNSGEGDKINLNSTAFNLPIGTLQSDLFVLGTTATNSAHRLIFDPANHTLFFDQDGTGATAQKAIAILSNINSLNASDIILV